jgi:hypothetical protein
VLVSWWWNTPHPAWGAALDRGNPFLTPGTGVMIVPLP